MGRDRAPRRPHRHGKGTATDTPALRVRAVLWATVVMSALIAGLTAVLWTTVGPGADGQASAPAPRVTVTAMPGPSPITAQAPPGNQLLLEDSEPAVIVEPSIDLSQHSIDDPASPWVVVNKARPLDPQSWEPPELSAVGDAQLVPDAATALQEMINDAAAAHVSLRVASGFRDYGVQQSLYNDYAAEFGQDRADRFSARPGFSEHHTGWAVDVYTSEECRLQACFADEAAGMWVAAHAHEHGFVVRYPHGAEAVTGYTYEPWHLRFVGPELATSMHERGIATLEQAFGLPAAPDYD